MDHETAADIKRHFNVVAEDLRSEIRTLTECQLATVEKLDRFERRVESDFGEVRSELGEVRTEVVDVRRHFNVVAEDLRSEIRTVAEGLQGFREEVANEFSAVRADLREQNALNRLAYADVNRRVSAHESDLTDIRTRLDRIEAGRKTWKNFPIRSSGSPGSSRVK
jgi:predicted  nucleic acid-binding Zn-ribbon protein